MPPRRMTVKSPPAAKEVDTPALGVHTTGREYAMAKPRVDMPMVEVADVLAILNKIALFGGLTDEQLHTVFGLLKKTRYARGEFIFEEGDEPSDIYIVFGGSVELLLEVDGDYLAEAVFGVGDCFGGLLRCEASAATGEQCNRILGLEVEHFRCGLDGRFVLTVLEPSRREEEPCGSRIAVVSRGFLERLNRGFQAA